MRQGTQTVTIPLSGTVSADVDLRGGRLQALILPGMTSGDLLIQGNFDSASGGFARIQSPLFNTPQSGDLRFATGPGSNMVLWPRSLPTPSYIRLESAVAQAALRAIQVRFGGGND